MSSLFSLLDLFYFFFQVSHLSLALSLANVLTNKNLAFPDRLPWLLTALVARSQQAIRQRAQPQQVTPLFREI